MLTCCSQIGNSILDVANFGLLLLLLMYVFALIGMQFFATKFRFDGDGNPVEWLPHVYNHTVPPHAPWTPERPYTISRSNFDDTLSAFTTVFQCLTEESWNFVMFDGIRSAGWSALVYFLAVMVVGNIIILNLFLAILLGNFSLDEQQTEVEAAMLKGQQKVIDAIAKSSIRKLSAVIPFAPNSSERTKSQPSLPDGQPPFLRQDTPTKRGHRIRRRSSQMTSFGSSRNLFGPDNDDGEPAMLSPIVPVGTPKNSFPSRSPSLRRLPSMLKLPETQAQDGSEIPQLRTLDRLSTIARLPQISNHNQTEGDTSLEPPSTLPNLSSKEAIPNENVPPTLRSVSSKSKLSHSSGMKEAGAVAKPRPPSTLLSASSTTTISQSGDSKANKTRAATGPPSTLPSISSRRALPAAADGSARRAINFKSPSSEKVTRDSSAKSISSRKNEVAVYDSDRSLFVFKRSGAVRHLCHDISRNSKFELLILTTIFIGSILLAVDNPLNDPSSTQSIVLGTMDNVFTGIFTVEMLLKIVDMGFIFNGSQSYLRDPWNVLDFTILSFSGATLVSSSKTLRSLRSFRTLRALVRRVCVVFAPLSYDSE